STPRLIFAAVWSVLPSRFRSRSPLSAPAASLARPFSSSARCWPVISSPPWSCGTGAPPLPAGSGGQTTSGQHGDGAGIGAGCAGGAVGRVVLADLDGVLAGIQLDLE